MFSDCSQNLNTPSQENIITFTYSNLTKYKSIYPNYYYFKETLFPLWMSFLKFLRFKGGN